MESEHDSLYSWTRLGLSLALALVGNVGMWAVIVVLPDMQAEFGIDRASATLPYAAAMLGFAIGNLTLGPAVDRWGITPVLAISAGALALGFALAAIADSVLVLSAVHIILGIGASASFGPLIADVSQWFMRRRGVAVAIAASGNYISGTIWPPVIVWLMEDHGWRGAYLFMALPVLLVVLPGSLILRRQINAVSTERAARDAASRAQMTGLSPRSLQILLAIAGVGCCVAMSMPQVHIVALCIDRGFGAVAGAEMLSLMLAGGVVSRLTFGVLADRFGGLKTLLLGASLQCLALCLFLLDGGLTSLYLVSLVFGLSQGGIVPSYAIIVREYMPPREAGRRVGLVMSATIMGMALGGWMSGWLYDQSGSYALAIWNGIGWNLITIVIALSILVRMGTARAAPA
jgi:MFS family permease